MYVLYTYTSFFHCTANKADPGFVFPFTSFKNTTMKTNVYARSEHQTKFLE